VGLAGAARGRRIGLPALDTYRAQLKTMLDTVREASAHQAAMVASKQEETKRLQGVLIDGRKLATFLRNGIRQRYGNRAEKLVEFDLAPLRPEVKASETAKAPVTPVTHPTTA
jgi:hypothetical protein